MNKKIIISALMVMAGGLAGTAQKLSLEECVNMALENNARMRTAQYSYEASRETSKEVFTKYFP